MYRQPSRPNNNNLFAALSEHTHHDLSEDEQKQAPPPPVTKGGGGGGGSSGGAKNSQEKARNIDSPVQAIFEQFKQTPTNNSASLQPSYVQSKNPTNHSNQTHDKVSQVPSIIQHKPPPLGENENPLETPYTFWFTQRGRGAKNKPNTAGDFEQNIRYITSVSSVEQFWRVYTHLVQPSELNGRCDIHVFRYGIRPMWEDEQNKEGGKWIVRLRKGFATRCWENLVLAMLGEQFLVGSEICGAVVSVRYHTEDIVSIWNRNASNQGVINQIRDIMKRVLNLPNNTIMEYKAHKESIKDASNRQQVQREQAEQNIRSGQDGGGRGGGGHHRGEREHHSPQSDRFNNSNGGERGYFD